MQRNDSQRLDSPRQLALAPGPLVTILDGTDEADTIEGTNGDDDIYGYGGDDVLYGNDGDDSLIGGVGYDWVLEGGYGNDTMNGGAGFDVAQFDYYFATGAVNFTAAVVNGSGSQVVVNAGVLGTDTLIGVEDITIYGSAYSDRLTGGGGFDYLAGDLGADTLNGGAGDDTLTGQGGADVLNGGTGYDSVEIDYYDRASGIAFDARAMTGGGNSVTLGGDSLNGIESVIVYGASAYSDTMTGSGGDDQLYGYGGSDVLRGAGGFDYLWGGGGNDTLTGGAGADQLEGDLGSDRLDGGGGYDTAIFDFSGLGFGIAYSAAAIGSSGTVVIGDGRGGTDTLVSVESADLIGSDHDDSLTGSGGDDFLTGGYGDDTLAGGGGFDIAVFDFYQSLSGVNFDASGVVPKNIVIVDAGMLGFDTLTAIEALDVYGSNYADRLVGGPGSDYVEGFAGNDVLIGNAGFDVMIGAEGNDRLNGAGGADELYGDAGADTLIGGGGNDFLSGGAGVDRFNFTVAPNAVSNQDTIDDFQPGVDWLQLENAVFAGLGPAGALAPSAFVLGTSATSAEDRIVYSTATGNLWFDGDGNGANAPILFALLAPGTALSADDIWVI